MSETCISLNIELRGPVADNLCRQADVRGKRPVDLLADIIEAVFREDLVKAVLDD